MGRGCQMQDNRHLGFEGWSIKPRKIAYFKIHMSIPDNPVAVLIFIQKPCLKKWATDHTPYDVISQSCDRRRGHMTANPALIGRNAAWTIFSKNVVAMWFSGFTQWVYFRNRGNDIDHDNLMAELGGFPSPKNSPPLLRYTSQVWASPCICLPNTCVRFMWAISSPKNTDPTHRKRQTILAKWSLQIFLPFFAGCSAWDDAQDVPRSSVVPNWWWGRESLYITCSASRVPTAASSSPREITLAWMAPSFTAVIITRWVTSQLHVQILNYTLYTV